MVNDMSSHIQFVDAAKYQSFLGIKPDNGEEVTTASAGTLAQAPKDSATMDTAPPSAEITTSVEGTKHPFDPRRLCEALRQMNNSLEHLEQGYFNCFHETVKATREVLADINEIDATYIDTVLMAMVKWQKDITLLMTCTLMTVLCGMRSTTLLMRPHRSSGRCVRPVISSVQPLVKLAKELW